MKLKSITTVALLPLSFTYSGLRTSINVVHGTLWIYTLLVIAVAVAGKFGGSMLAARMSGAWRNQHPDRYSCNGSAMQVWF